ncbi:MAG TPA: glycosyltransferase family 4 protein [Polyangiales bacterium]|nr:glycosyltransferase family 4 protein [Polyangiales bacterium]
MTRRTLRVHTLIDSLTWGGAEMLLADLAGAAPSAGIEMSVGYLDDVNGSPALPRLLARGVEPRLLDVRRMLDASALRRVRSHLRTVKPDVVHTHLSTADALGGLAARSLGIPAVCTIHLIGRAVSEPPGLRTNFRGATVALARRVGDRRIVAVSDAARSAYVERYRERAHRVVTVHNGIATPAPKRSGGEIRGELGLDPDALVAAIVAVLREGKGHALAVDAVAQLRRRFPELALLVVGEGPLRTQLERQAATMGTRAVFAGHREDVAELLQAVDVLVHPTEMDAFPTVLLEASAASLPVLATRVGGIPEIVDDGKTGVLLDAPATSEAVAEQLERLLGDADLRARLGDAARARFELEFSAERWAARLRELYDQLTSSAG